MRSAARCFIGWWYLTIVSTLAGLVLIYPAIVMIQVTDSVKLATTCVEDVGKIGLPGVNTSDITDVMDTIHQILVAITVPGHSPARLFEFFAFADTNCSCVF